MREDLRVQRGEQVDIGHGEIGAGDFLADDARRQAAHAEPAEFSGSSGAMKPIAPIFHQPTIEHARAVALLKSRRDAFGRKAADLDRRARDPGRHTDSFSASRDADHARSSSSWPGFALPSTSMFPAHAAGFRQLSVLLSALRWDARDKPWA